MDRCSANEEGPGFFPIAATYAVFFCDGHFDCCSEELTMEARGVASSTASSLMRRIRGGQGSVCLFVCVFHSPSLPIHLSHSPRRCKVHFIPKPSGQVIKRTDCTCVLNFLAIATPPITRFLSFQFKKLVKKSRAIA